MSTSKTVSFLVSLAAGYLFLLVLLLLAENRIVFIPTRELWTTPADRRIPAEDVRFSTSDGIQLHGWFFPAAERKGALLFLHGNAGNIADRIDNAVGLTLIGMDVLLFDYRGYGRSQGSPDERGVFLDARAALQWLRAVKQVSPDELFIFGRSLGGAVAVDLAVEHPPKALVLESTFCSVKDMARGIFPYMLFTPFLPNHFDSLSKIPRLKCPLLSIHGTADRVVPYSQGRKLFAAAPEPKRFHPLAGADHNNPYGGDESAYFATLARFFEEHSPAR